MRRPEAEGAHRAHRERKPGGAGIGGGSIVIRSRLELTSGFIPPLGAAAEQGQQVAGLR
jgi:hypothetical protein